jgi:phosphinothricin acetyltransferase
MTAIRLASEQDAAAIQAIYAPYVRETVISFEAEPPDVETMRERICKILEMFPWLVCEYDGEIVGFAYASRHRERHAYQWSVDATVYVRRGLQRSGVGRGLYTSLFALLRLQGFFNAYAGIALPNDASVGLHRALGFQPVGVYEHVGYKLGKWHSVAWMGLTLQPPAESPAPPRPLPEIITHPDAQIALNSGLSAIRLK